MKAQKENSNKNNYVFQEIKEIKGKKNLPPCEFEIIEDLNEVHEIKEINNNKHFDKINKNLDKLNQEIFQKKVIIQLEDNLENNINDNYDLLQNVENESENTNKKITCNICQQEIDDTDQNEGCDENQNIDNGEQHIKFGFVKTPLFSGENQNDEIDKNELNENNNNINENDNEENYQEEEKMDNLIEAISQQLTNDDIFNNNDLKFSFKELNEDRKNEIIEAIKIMIDNEEQENRFNKFLEIIE